jgi:hypothetical protein
MRSSHRVSQWACRADGPHYSSSLIGNLARKLFPVDTRTVAALAAAGQLKGCVNADLGTGSISTELAVRAMSGFTVVSDRTADIAEVRFVPTHKVAALQPAAREQEPRDR